MIPNQWYAILPSKAVRPDRVVGIRRFGQDLALFRDAEGTVACVTDKCSHRGAALSKGRVRSGCVKCPFHGLEFDHKGRCILVPANGSSSVADLSRFNVEHHVVREENGIIYFWYGEAEKVNGEPPFFPDDIDGSYVFSEMEDHWNAHYSRCIENQLDVVHLPFVHHDTIGRGNKTLVNGPKVELLENGLITSADNEVDTGQTPRKADESRIKDTYLHFLFPNIWMNHISDKMKIVIFFAPVDDENTILYIRFYSKVAGTVPLDALIAQIGKIGNGIVERQDKRVVITQKPKASAYISQENLLAGDGPVIQYRRMRERLKKETTP